MSLVLPLLRIIRDNPDVTIEQAVNIGGLCWTMTQSRKTARYCTTMGYLTAETLRVSDNEKTTLYTITEAGLKRLNPPPKVLAPIDPKESRLARFCGPKSLKLVEPPKGEPVPHIGWPSTGSGLLPARVTFVPQPTVEYRDGVKYTVGPSHPYEVYKPPPPSGRNYTPRYMPSVLVG